MLRKYVLLIALFMVFNVYLEGEVNAEIKNKEVIRLHVIANSDSVTDQELKLKVRDEILNDLSKLEKVSTKQDAEDLIVDNIPDLTKKCEEVIETNGFNYPINISLTTSIFPTKKYHNTIFSAGEYEAVKAIIGKGEGKNWWCVLYPPLCHVDWFKEKKNIEEIEDEDVCRVMAPVKKSYKKPLYFFGNLKRILLYVWL